MNSGRSGKRAAIAPIVENKCIATFNFVRDAGKLYPLDVSPGEYFIICGLLRRRGGLYSLPKLYSDKALLGRLGHTAGLPFSRELGPISFHLSHVPLNQPQERLMATQKKLIGSPAGNPLSFAAKTRRSFTIQRYDNNSLFCQHLYQPLGRF